MSKLFPIRFLITELILLVLLTVSLSFSATPVLAYDVGTTIPGGTLHPDAVPKFDTPLVIPPVMPPTGVSADGFVEYQISVREISQSVLPDSMGLDTTVWAYGDVNSQNHNFPGFTIETRRNQPVRVEWVNDLVAPDGECLDHLLPVDQTLHWANPANPSMANLHGNLTADPTIFGIPMVTHVHGARVPGTSDGFPEAWWLPDCTVNGVPVYDETSGYAPLGINSPFGGDYSTEQPAVDGSAIFEYPNDQRASTLWYHDHSLGLTRLNVYAGMAGFWLLRDNAEDSLALPGPAPRLGDTASQASRYREIPIVIQDRSFNADGSFFYPESRAFFDGYAGPFKSDDNNGDGIADSPISPIWNPEFFGNMMVVNGKTWPYLNVQPDTYRLRYLNGTQSRFLILKLETVTVDANGNEVLTPITGTPFVQIGSEGGLLPAPVWLDGLLMAPAERADVLIDFSQFAGQTIRMTNIGPDEPYGGGIPGLDFPVADPASTGQVMEFRVAPGRSRGRSAIDKLKPFPTIAPISTVGAVNRYLTLNENMYEVLDPATGAVIDEIPQAALLGTVDEGALEWGDDITEDPTLNTTEVWNVINLTGDAHPIHLHLVMFQVLDRAPIIGENPDGTPITGPAISPEAWETGLKDTVIAYPDEVTRIVAHFDLPGLYVWHCHILEHEDQEMMRAYEVVTNGTLDLSASIDVLPDDPFNMIDCGRDGGVLPVVFYGSPDLDVSSIDHASVRLNGAWERRLSNQDSTRVRDVADVNGDGYLDLAMQFEYSQLGLTCASTGVTIEGLTTTGYIFTHDITINMATSVGCGPAYWNATAVWPAPFAPSKPVHSVFAVPTMDVDNNGMVDRLNDALLYPAGTPLYDALREGTAALLNAAHADIPFVMTADEIILAFSTAYETDAAALSAFAAEMAALNGGLCPLLP